MNTIKVNDTVKYSEPMKDEVGMTFQVIEVNGDRCIIEANNGMHIKPTYVAKVADLSVVK